MLKTHSEAARGATRSSRAPQSWRWFSEFRKEAQALIRRSDHLRTRSHATYRQPVCYNEQHVNENHEAIGNLASSPPQIQRTIVSPKATRSSRSLMSVQQALVRAHRRSLHMQAKSIRGYARTRKQIWTSTPSKERQ
ncbi:hypothetical protein F1559_003591 [Cyanidiococcus yangmingshanensis]|uniref:Uncharacterized protein n=1 Tax=Cyanidiococcus yangmingshanensis TaxID=2690220 RepID=A0A7J7IPM0_9RHOD|nr:hypothetical protein F1559_003591 [Cyanidiococcus yangmingshanensis]